MVIEEHLNDLIEDLNIGSENCPNNNEEIEHELITASRAVSRVYNLNKENFNTNIMINLTNDSWFGKFSGPYQHFYFTKLRAAQFNKLTIRVSNNGISGIIDNKGKIIEYIGLNQKKNLVHSLNINKEKINYLRFHNTIPWIIIMLLIFFLFADRYYEKRKI